MISLELFQAYIRRFSIIFTIVSSSFLLGCSSSSEKQTTEIITIPRIPSAFIDPPSSRDDLKSTDYSSQFDQLKNKKVILSSIKVGRTDPFQLPLDDDYAFSNPPDMFLTGIIKVNGVLKALITKEGTYGAVMEGETGSVENNLLPSGWLVKNIDEENAEIVLTYRDKNLILSLERE